MTKRNAPRAAVFAGEIGSFWSFKTEKLFRSRLKSMTGRYGVFLVLKQANEYSLCVVLDGVFGAPPLLDDVLPLPFLVCERFAYASSPKVAAHYIFRDSFESLADLQCLGSRPLRADAADLVARYPHLHESYGSADTLAIDAEGEWSWRHDRPALLADYEIEERKRNAQLLVRQKREKAYLASLTFEKLSKENWFKDWTLPPKEFTSASLSILRDALNELWSLRLPRKRADVRRILKASALRLGKLDQQFGEVIETEEREDLMEVLWKLAIVSGHRTLIKDIDESCDW